MSPFKRGSTWWTSVGGERVSLRTKSRAVAAERAAELANQAARQRLGLEQRNKNPRGLTLSEAVDLHLRGPAAKQLQREKLAHTLRKHVQRDPIGELPLERVTRGVVVEWLERREQAGAAPATLNRLRSNLSAIFARMIEREAFFGDNPCRGVARRAVEQGDPSATPWPMVPGLLEHMPTTAWTVAAAFAVFGGLRRGEIQRAQWSDLDIRARMMTVPKTKTGVRRIVPLHRELVAVLEQLQPREEARTGPVVMLGPAAWGKSHAIVRNALRRAGADNSVGLACHFHGLRSTWSTRLIDCGADPFIVQLIGWGARGVMAKHYLRPTRALLDAIDLLTYEPAQVLPMSTARSQA
jgi:integrase